jgi:hypothetical protein
MPATALDSIYLHILNERREPNVTAGAESGAGHVTAGLSSPLSQPAGADEEGLI